MNIARSRPVKVLVKCLEAIPFYGPRFFLAGWKAHKMAFYEFLFTTVFSTIPLWLGSLLIMAVKKKIPDTPSGFYDTLLTIIDQGDLFLYCTSVLTTIAWLNIKHSMNVDSNNEEEHLPREDLSALRDDLNLPAPAEQVESLKSYKSVYPPNKFLFLSFAILGIIVSVAFYALNLAGITVSPLVLRNISVSTYAVSLLLYHNVLVSDHAGFEEYEKRISRGTQQFVDGYAAHRRGEE